MAHETTVMPTIRDIDFDLPADRIKSWHPYGIHTTYLFGAMSLFFPEGEKFFIQSVRHYRDRIPAGDPLAKAVTAFIGQEGAHGREHRAYNAALEKAGLPMTAMEQKIIRILNFTRKITFPAQKLAVTIALEHFTAILAHDLLKNSDVLDQADPRFAALWRWHAMEETEHKAVAYDVYQRFCGGFFGYLRRCLIMVTTSVMFVWDTWRFHYALLKHDNLHRDWAGWRTYLRFAFVSPGVFRRIFPAWLAYFKPGFHPWQQDDRALLAEWQAKFPSSGPAVQAA